MKEALNLNNRKWKSFKVSDIFYIFTGALLNKEEMQEGNIPRITATDINNGVALFTNRVESNKFRTFENFISISFLGSVFYQKNLSSLDMKIHGISPKGYNLNSYSAKFLIPIIKKFAFKYHYGYQLSTSILRRQKMLLPINNESLPDWLFMENYIKQKEFTFKKLLTTYYTHKNLNITIIDQNLKDKQWKSFFIGGEDGVFDIKATKSGIDKNKLSIIEGNTPYITRSNIDNGIQMFVNKQKTIYQADEGNVITIGLDTQTVFYQENPFYTGQNIQILRNPYLNKYIALFIIPLLKLQMQKFSWGSNGATLGRLNRTKILLPVNEKGSPDWNFMENYIKQKEQIKINSILNHYKK
ncbi:restriction endonuclease subunit S [Capnocytophaga sp. oral taxon 902]|jgi:restriction enzyme|uniref:restriction endonuclease subunit S n=2 Tax=Capnocytophaga TaxID=1016 RepID=UPI0015BAAFE3|nr:restriction endonuclease subunit S [Capnocytophaga sp. oral taxon 902]QLF49972.1 restriction endonuclease subunit S [Capnocytophaga sp. oral taxon 902]